jgi:hypothetical protein
MVPGNVYDKKFISQYHNHAIYLMIFQENKKNVLILRDSRSSGT